MYHYYDVILAMTEYRPEEYKKVPLFDRIFRVSIDHMWYINQASINMKWLTYFIDAWRILQFILPAYSLENSQLFSGSIEKVFRNILSVIKMLMTCNQKYEISMVTAVFAIINTIFAILFFSFSLYYKKNHTIVQESSVISYIIIHGYLNVFPGILSSMIGEFIGRAITGEQARDTEFWACIVTNILFLIISIRILTAYVYNPLIFKLFPQSSYSPTLPSIFLILTVILSLLSPIITRFSNLVQIIFNIFKSIFYLISFLLPFKLSQYVSTTLGASTMAASILGIFISLETSFLISLEMTTIPYLFGVHLCVFILLVPLMKCFLYKYDSSTLYKLDSVIVDKEQFALHFKNQYLAFVGATTAFRYGHPIMEDWQMMRYCTANYLYYMPNWEALLRFTSCYTEERRMTEWTLNYVWMLFPRSTELACLRIQAHNVLRERSLAFSRIMEDNLDDLLQDTIYSTALTKSFWELVAKGNSHDIQFAATQLQKHIKVTNNKYLVLAHKHPSSPQVLFDYLRFLGSTYIDPPSYAKYGNAYARMRSSKEIWENRYMESVTELFDNVIQNLHPKRFTGYIVGSSDNTGVDDEGSSSSLSQQIEYEDLNETEIEDMNFLVEVVENMNIPFINHSIRGVIIMTVIFTVVLIGFLGILYGAIRVYGTNELNEVEKKSELACYINFLYVVLNRHITKVGEKEKIPGEDINFANCDMNLIINHSILSMIKESAKSVKKMGEEVSNLVYKHDNITILPHIDKLIGYVKEITTLQGASEVNDWLEKNIEEFFNTEVFLIQTLTNSCKIHVERFTETPKILLNWKLTINVVTSLLIFLTFILMAIMLSYQLHFFIKSISRYLMMIPKRYVSLAVQKIGIKLKELEPETENDKYYHRIRSKIINETLQPLRKEHWLTETSEISFWAFSLCLSITLIIMTITYTSISEEYSKEYSSVIPQNLYNHLIQIHLGMTVSSFYILGYIDTSFLGQLDDLRNNVHQIATTILNEFDSEFHAVLMSDPSADIKAVFYDESTSLWEIGSKDLSNKWMTMHEYFEELGRYGKIIIFRMQLARLYSIKYVYDKSTINYRFSTKQMHPQSHYYIAHISDDLIEKLFKSEPYNYHYNINHPIKHLISLTVTLLMFICIFTIGALYSLKYVRIYMHDLVYVILAVHPQDILGTKAISDLLLGKFELPFNPEDHFSEGFFDSLSHGPGKFLIIATDNKFDIKAANDNAMKRIDIKPGTSIKLLLKDKKLWKKVNTAISGKIPFNFTVNVAINEGSFSVLVIARSGELMVESTTNGNQSINGFIFVLDDISQLAKASKDLVTATTNVTKLMKKFIPGSLINNFISGTLESYSFSIQTASIAMVSLGNLNKPGPERMHLLQLHDAFTKELDNITNSSNCLTHVNALSHSYIVISGIFSGKGVSPEIGARACTSFAVDAVKLIEAGLFGRGVGAKAAVISGGQLNVVVANSDVPSVEVVSELIDSAQKALCNAKVGHVVIFESTRVLLRNADFSVKERRGENSPPHGSKMKIYSVIL